MSAEPTPASPVAWRADGTPFSPRFGDVYRSAGLDGSGGLAQARHVFLHGCGLLPDGSEPSAWAGAARWAVLETGFGLGLNFLATWHAWKADAARPSRLFYSAIEAYPPEVCDLRRSAAAFPELAALARALAAQWHGLVRGFHRFQFEGGRVLLTLIVDDVAPALKGLAGLHDSIYLDGFSPAVNPRMWSDQVVSGAARHARVGARAATWCVAHDVRERLTRCGFETERVPGAPPKRHALRARFVPAAPRAARAVPADVRPARCIIIGGGLAGASAARSLAERGWQVTVMDHARDPAAGASAVPAGIYAPHVSADDCLLSQLTRAGIAALQARAARLLRPGLDFSGGGVLELHPPGKRRLPPWWPPAEAPWATAPESFDSGCAVTWARAHEAGVALGKRRPALWHTQAGWMRPAALVAACLDYPCIRWQGGVQVATIRPGNASWQALDSAGAVLGEAELVVVAAGLESRALLPDRALPLHALGGQIAWGPYAAAGADTPLPRFPVNGQGYLISQVPGASAPLWVAGSTFERDSRQAPQRASAHAANWEQLNALLPGAATALRPAWERGAAHAWAGVRATLPDHLPAVGGWPGEPAPGPDHPSAAVPRERAASAPRAGAAPARLPLQLCTALGARGLTLATLCGELLAARLHGEPLPISRSLADHLRADRYATRLPPQNGA